MSPFPSFLSFFFTPPPSFLSLSRQPEDMEFKYWRPFILFLAKTSMEDGQYVPQDGMIHLVHQLMKRGQGLSLFAGVIEGTFEVRCLRLCGWLLVL